MHTPSVSINMLLYVCVAVCLFVLLLPTVDGCLPTMQMHCLYFNMLLVCANMIPCQCCHINTAQHASVSKACPWGCPFHAAYSDDSCTQMTAAPAVMLTAQTALICYCQQDPEHRKRSLSCLLVKHDTLSLLHESFSLNPGMRRTGILQISKSN